MRTDLSASRSFWMRIALVGAAIWVGGTILYSLARMGADGPAFQFFDYQGDPDNALWFALAGAVLVFAVCNGTPWIMFASRPRPFWTRIAIVAAGIWIGATVLYSLVRSSPAFAFGLRNDNTDNALWFALVGALLLFAICASIPWIMTGVLPESGAPGSCPSTAPTIAAADANALKHRKSRGWNIAGFAGFLFGAILIRALFTPVLYQPTLSTLPTSPPPLALAPAYSPPRDTIAPSDPEHDGTQSASTFVNGILSGVHAPMTPVTGQTSDAQSAPSLDCAKTNEWAQLRGCATPALAQDDQRMGQIYEQLIASLASSEQSVLRVEQQEWITSRDLCFIYADWITCLSKAYASRLSTLSARISAAEAASSQSPIPIASPDKELPVSASPISEAPASITPCTKEDEEVARMAKRHGYQYRSTCKWHESTEASPH